MPALGLMRSLADTIIHHPRLQTPEPINQPPHAFIQSPSRAPLLYYRVLLGLLLLDLRVVRLDLFG